MRVRVYRNLNKGGLSIQVKTEKGWRARDYSLFVVLKNCSFRVSESGRQKVLRERQKNVHAWVEGDLISKDEKDFLQCGFSEPWYDPYKTDHFEVDGERVEFAENLRIFSPPKGALPPKGKKESRKVEVSGADAKKVADNLESFLMGKAA